MINCLQQPTSEGKSEIPRLVSVHSVLLLLSLAQFFEKYKNASLEQRYLLHVVTN